MHFSIQTSILLLISFFLVMSGCAGDEESCSGSGDPSSCSESSAPSLNSPPALNPPNAPAIINPSLSPYSSSESSIKIVGTCDSGNVINLTGSGVDFTTCVGGAFEFTLNQLADGTYNYLIAATNSSNQTSKITNFQWIRSVLLPLTPIITLPSTPVFVRNTSNLAISGVCESGNTVNISGDIADSVMCANNVFSFTVSKAIDGIYNFIVSQTNPGNQTSGQVSQVWIRDTTAPDAPIILGSLVVNNNSNSIVLEGACETGATVKISGSGGSSASCVDAKYSLTILNAVDGTYSYDILQTDLAGNDSLNSINFKWVRDTAAPPAIIINSPSVNPYYSNSDSITLSGTCEDGDQIILSGDANATGSCTNSSFAFSISKSTDGSYSFFVNQTDQVGNVSPRQSFIWNRDTIPPFSPILSTPFINPYTSAAPTLGISGTCEFGATVYLNGNASDSIKCADGFFSLNVAKISDGIYNFNITQIDAAGNNSTPISAPVDVQWIKSSSFTSSLTVVAPADSPYYSNTDSISVSGACTDASVIEVTGDATLNVDCVASAYSFNVQKITDGTYTFNLKERNSANIFLGSAQVIWVRDTVSPGLVALSSPSLSQIINNGNSISFNGSCELNSFVYIGGSISPTAMIACLGGSFEFVDSRLVDGDYNYVLHQTDLAGNSSGFSSVAWTRDTTAPSNPSVTSPALSPYTSSIGSLNISGTCEPNANVNISNNGSIVSIICSATGIYSSSSPFIQTVSPGTVVYDISQTDIAGNISGTTSVTWIFDTGSLSVPIISYAGTAGPGNFITKLKSLSINATCTSGYEVNLTGSVAPATLVCGPSGSVNFALDVTTDGSYSVYVSQTDPVSGDASSAANFNWSVDNTAPSTPVITSPAMNPFTAPGNLNISGTCENNATVILAGSAAQSVLCTNSQFSFSIVAAVDNTYNYVIAQTDLASNNSAAVNFQWIRNSAGVPPPTISNGISVINNLNTVSDPTSLVVKVWA